MFGLVSKKKYTGELERRKNLEEEFGKTELKFVEKIERLKRRCEVAIKNNIDLKKDIKKHKEVIEFKNSCETGYKNTIKTLKKREEYLLNLKQEEFTNVVKQELLNKLEDFRSETR